MIGFSLRDIGIVARHDVTDSFRSRKAILWVLLYLISALAATFFFTIALREIESEVARLARIGEARQAGVMTQSLWESNSFRRMVEGLVGDRDLANSLIRKPPLVLFFGWLSLTFSPFLIVLLAGDSISSDVASGTSRFILTRIDRFSWVTGKLAGQALVLLAAIAASGIGAYAVGMFRLAGFAYGRTAVGLLIACLKAWCYCLPFLGLAVGVSQLSRKVPLTRILSIVLYFAGSILAVISDHMAGAGWRRVWELLYILLPQGHRRSLWIDDPQHLLSAGLFFVALCVLYYVSGYIVFARRDA